jgi:hypothetical protein
MIARFIVTILIGVFTTSPIFGAVAYTALANIPVFQGDLFPATERLDLNSDGAWDIEFYAHDDTFRISINPKVEVLAVPAVPPNLGGFIDPLTDGFIIEASSTSGSSTWLSDSAAFYSCALFGESLVCLGFWGNGVEHLGFRIEEDDGFHYGYVTVDSPFLGIHGGFIQGFGYESSAGVPIRAGAIPEASTSALFVGGLIFVFVIWDRKRRS